MQLLQSVAAPAGTDFVFVECELSPRRNILNVFRISQKIKVKLWCNPFNTTLWIISPFHPQRKFLNRRKYAVCSAVATKIYR